MAQAPAIFAIPFPDIVRRYAAGESTLDLATEAKVERSTLYRYMFSEGREEYEAIITQCLVNRIADADLALETADGMSQVSRGAHRARFARMDLERRRPALYGPKQDVNVNSKSIVVHVHRDTKPPPVDINPVKGLTDETTTNR